jgi:holo-[acyl-carrier protein] synthase
MIFGIGTDIIEISRIERLIKKEGFCERCFTARELEYIGDRPQSAAACYAAKEAYSKAVGTGVRGFSLKDIEILHDGLGRPYIKAYNSAYLKDCEAFLSLSHCREYAVAYVLIEKSSSQEAYL